MAFITREDLPFLGYTAVTLSLRVIPRSWRLRWSRTLANGLGALWYRLDRSSAALAHKNLRAVLGPRLPDRKLEATAMAHFHNIALHKVINDMLRHLTRQELTRYVTVEGEEHLQQALAAGRGVVLLGAHSGAHGYIPLMVLKRLGYQITPVVGEEATPHNSWVYCHVVNPIRRVNWNEFPMINPVGTPQREMVECLRQGGILVIWPDFIGSEPRSAPAACPARPAGAPAGPHHTVQDRHVPAGALAGRADATLLLQPPAGRVYDADRAAPARQRRQIHRRAAGRPGRLYRAL